MSEQLDFLRILSHNCYKILGLSAITLGLIYVKAYRLYTKSNYCSTIRLDDKTVIVTGANTGIGYEVALDLAKRGARVILACRNANKANNSAHRIREITSNENVFVEIIDLTSLDSVKKFFLNFIEKYKSVDILINNAGMYK
jgi:FlaA1/EpsC-like NDP-sugar epimerase